MKLLAIDPGPKQSAYLTFDDVDQRVGGFGILPNDQILAGLRDGAYVFAIDRIVIEKIEAMGMAVGAETFETVWWSGQFAEAAHPLPVERVTRRAVKLHLCQSMRAKDPNIRAALIDRFGGAAAIGRKAAPGPLYGIAADVWSALAVAVTFADGAS